MLNRIMLNHEDLWGAATQKILLALLHSQRCVSHTVSEIIIASTQYWICVYQKMYGKNQMVSHLQHWLRQKTSSVPIEGYGFSA